METAFYTKLSSLILKRKSKQNILFSPSSIRICLALAYLGADGNTAEEIRQALSIRDINKDATIEKIYVFLQNIKSGTIPLTIISRIFLKDEFKINPKYNEIASRYLNAEAEKVDFNDSHAAADKINKWIEIQTQNRIKNVILSTNIDKNTASILVNTIYFRGEWANKFNSQSTEKRFFFANRRRRITVDMMFQMKDFMFSQLNDLDAYAFEMPYKSSDLSMLVLLPKAIDGLAAFESKLDLNRLMEVKRRLKLEKLHLGFPKFKIEFDISLQPILEELDMKTMFSKNADFSNILAVKAELFVSEVVHKTLIEVDEKGTETPNVTYFKVPQESTYFDIRDIIVDHPFFFVITDKEDIYFVGHVVDFSDYP